jgi:hypothetical protein
MRFSPDSYFPAWEHRAKPRNCVQHGTYQRIATGVAVT